MSFVPLPTDTYSGAVETIDFAHSRIHAGKAYCYSDSVTLGNGGTQDYLLTTPASSPYIHLTFSSDGSAITAFALYEGSDKSGTTTQTLYNNNRNSANTTSLSIKKGTSGGTTDGTKIWGYSDGSAQGASRSSSKSNFSDEYILKLNTKYIFRITSGTSDNMCNVEFNWYELP